MQQSFNNPNIQLNQNIDDTIKIPADKSFPLGLVINEFLTNSYKYAFKQHEKGTISINLHADKNGLKLQLSDNGKGLPKEFDIEKTESFGMRIMKLLSEQLKGTFSLDNTKGVKLTVQFPL